MKELPKDQTTEFYLKALGELPREDLEVLCLCKMVAAGFVVGVAGPIGMLAEDQTCARLGDAIYLKGLVAFSRVTERVDELKAQLTKAVRGN